MSQHIPHRPELNEPFQPGDDSRPRLRTRRRVGDYPARKFWELCVISQIASGNLPSGNPVSVAIRDADAALISWRERWEKVPGAGPAVSPFTWGRNPEARNTDTLRDDVREHFRDTPDSIFTGSSKVPGFPPALAPALDGSAPPVVPGKLAHQGVPVTESTPQSPHRFVSVAGYPYCGECGGGKLHLIHQGEAPDAGPADNAPPFRDSRSPRNE